MQRIKKWLKRIFVATALLAVIGAVAIYFAVRRSLATPPPLPKDVSILQLKPAAHDGKIFLGKSWRDLREDLPVVCLKGSPFEMGYADGVLMEDKMHTLEREFQAMLKTYVPRRWVKETVKAYIFWRNRHLSDFVAEDYRLELYGTTLGCKDINPEEGNFYNRLLNYHAAHDISYMMIDNPFLARSAGCTAFGAWGNETSGGHLITGRNFDWEAAEVFSRDRVVEMFEPDNGIPFISLSWAGMAGVLSGMNRAGVSVTINGAPSKLPNSTATPVAMVARAVLQHAHNLDEVLKIVRGAKVFVSTIWLVGSRADGKFIVVEKTPDVTNVREAVGDSIVCPNHFETDGLKAMAQNTNYMAEATSRAREQRLTELLKQNTGTVDAARSVKFLRDRDLPGGVFAGNGHRSSLNAFIATHAVVMDLTAGIFWAAAPPHGLGKFVAFDVNDFSRELPELTIPADAVLADGEFDRVKQSRKFLDDGGRALKNNDATTALGLAKKAAALNPGFYENFILEGRALLALGRKAEAVKALEAALAASPAFLSERQNVEELLRQARAAN